MNCYRKKEEKRVKQHKLVVLITILCVMLLFSIKTEANARTITGKNGKNLTWKIDDGVLTLSGKGAMKGCGHKKMKWHGEFECYYENKEDWWEEYQYEIKSVVIEEGVTNNAPMHFQDFLMQKQSRFPQA